MHVKKTVIAVGLVMSLAGSPEGEHHGGHDQGPMRHDPAEMQQRRTQRHRLMQVVGLAEELGLSTQDALRMDEIIRRFDERRRPLREQVQAAGQVVKNAARGDAAAAGQVDQAIERVLDARIQLATLDKEMFQALAKDLDPRQRARLALFYARLHKMKGDHMMMKGERKMMMKGGLGPDDDGPEGRRFRRWRMRRGDLSSPAAPGAVAGTEPFSDD